MCRRGQTERPIRDWQVALLKTRAKCTHTFIYIHIHAYIPAVQTIKIKSNRKKKSIPHWGNFIVTAAAAIRTSHLENYTFYT